MKRTGFKGRDFGAAIIVALAMLVQAAVGMTPGMAMAGTGQTIQICTGHGSKTITVDQAGQPSAPRQTPCPHCDQCLSPALAVSATAAPVLVQPVRYAVRVEPAPASAITTTSARGPPRPPSQAPPALLNV